MRGVPAELAPSNLRAARWRRMLLSAVSGAAALIVAIVAAGVLAEVSLLGFDRPGLRTQILWPVLPALTVLVSFAAAATLRLVQILPDRTMFKVRDGVWFAAACATLVLVPSAILLERWAQVGAYGGGYRLIQSLEFLSQGLVLLLLLRAALLAWYADWEPCPA